MEDFAQYQAALDLGDEQVEMTAALNTALGAADDPKLAAKVAEQATKGRSEFDQYLYEEQSALVEGLVRAYARRRLRPLLEQYEVLEVEREGSWELGQYEHEWETDPEIRAYDCCKRCGIHKDAARLGNGICMELWFMSRPDALLLERQSKQLYILSFKTAAKWDRRKAEDAKRDMQGLSEGVEVEKRLAGWWNAIHWCMENEKPFAYYPPDKEEEVPPMNVAKYLMNLSAPPRIMGIRYEYMLKGERWTDKELSQQLGVEVRSQRSPLVRGYLNQGMAAGDEQWNVSWDYVKEDGTVSKLYHKNWKSSPVFCHMPHIKEWIDKLDGATMTQGEEGRELGYSCGAQATGYLEEHPLDALFIPPIVIYRNDDELRDWIEQVEAQEVRVAEAVAKVRAAQDEGEKRHLLNVLFPMTRRACSYPTNCAMIPLCWGGEEIRRGPLESGLYQIRLPNHPQERDLEADSKAT